LEFLENRLQPGSVLTGILSGGLLGISPTVLDLGSRFWEIVQSEGGEVGSEPQGQFAAFDPIPSGADTDSAFPGLRPGGIARSEALAISPVSADLPGSTGEARFAETWADDSSTWLDAIPRNGSGQATIIAQFDKAARFSTAPEGVEAPTGLAIREPVGL